MEKLHVRKVKSEYIVPYVILTQHWDSISSRSFVTPVKIMAANGHVLWHAWGNGDLWNQLL